MKKFLVGLALFHVWVSCACGQVLDAGAADDPAKPEKLPPPTNAAVLSVVESNPERPADLIEAADLLARLDRPDYARQYLEKVTAMNLAPNSLAQLHRKFGTGLFLRLSGDSDLNPVAQQLTEKILVAANQSKRDPKRIQALIGRLGQTKTRQEKLKLAGQLVYSGPHAVGPLMTKLAAPQAAQVAPTVRSILVRIGKEAIAPLLSYFQSDDERLRSEAMIILGALQANDALPFLARPILRPSSSGEQARASAAYRQIAGRSPEQNITGALKKLADLRFRGIVSESSEGRVDVWTWNFDAQAPRLVSLNRVQAAAVFAGRFYAELAMIQPSDEEFRLRHLISKLEADKSIGGLDVPLRTGKKSATELAAQYGFQVTELALKRSMLDGHDAAAMGAAEILGQTENQDLLKSSGGMPTVLATAMTHANPRIRFHAAMAILELEFETPFAGIEMLADTLGFFAGSTGTRHAVVAHPKLGVAQTIAGALESAGFETLVVADARRVMSVSSQSPDFEFLLLSDGFNGPTPFRIIQEMRRDPKTAQLPIGLLTREFHRNRSNRIADSDELVMNFAELTEPEDVLRFASRLLTLNAADRIPDSVRKRQAELALDGLLQISDRPELGVNLVRHLPAIQAALYDRQFALKAIRLLERTPSPDAQSSLLGVANSDLIDWKRREAAFDALSKSIEQMGLLLSKQEISRQFEILETDQDEQASSALRSLGDLIKKQLGDS